MSIGVQTEDPLTVNNPYNKYNNSTITELKMEMHIWRCNRTRLVTASDTCEAILKLVLSLLSFPPFHFQFPIHAVYHVDASGQLLSSMNLAVAAGPAMLTSRAIESEIQVTACDSMLVTTRQASYG